MIFRSGIDPTTVTVHPVYSYTWKEAGVQVTEVLDGAASTFCSTLLDIMAVMRRHAKTKMIRVERADFRVKVRTSLAELGLSFRSRQWKTERDRDLLNF